jgi:DNA-binding GntR family transcriptional regulator
LSHRTYELIKDRLLDGRYAGGERLPVDALRGEFGVSKQPVMDALRRLSADGLVEIIPQVGCQVARYTTAEVADFFMFFGELEASIAEVAAGRRTAAQLARMDTVSEQIAKVAYDGDPAERAHRYRVLNRDFHAVIGERHADHERIRDALMRQDGPAARAAMASHIARTVTPA